jgi:hypothetical protein
MTTFDTALDALRRRAEAYGIAVRTARLDAEEPAVFTGLDITLNDTCDTESSVYYLVHSIGSIVEWSLRPDHSKGIYSELRRAKRTKDKDAQRFAAALHGFLAFEETASEYAVWLLADTGSGHLVEPYTMFARADAEAMEQFHREGVAPVWREFFPAFKQQVARGERSIRPYRARAVPSFVPVRIERQEVVQEVDGEA